VDLVAVESEAPGSLRVRLRVHGTMISPPLSRERLIGSSMEPRWRR
jgi:hypothetical protein